jgi:hypothetical protein
MTDVSRDVSEPVGYRYKHSSHRSWTYADERPTGDSIHLFVVEPLYSIPPVAAMAGEPVAWRVKDYADGWIVFASEVDARLEAKQTGALLEPLYSAPPMATMAGDHS